MTSQEILELLEKQRKYYKSGATLPISFRIGQLKKLYVVKKVEVLDDEPIKRELMLIKVQNQAEHRSDIMTAVDVFRASVIDYSTEGMCIEVTGSPSKIDAFVKLMQPVGILEMCRTGIGALDRGTVTLLSK